MTKEQVRKTRPKKAEKPTEDAPSETKDEKPTELLAHTDSLLDEIDLLLEPNAEEFVAGYKQQGGQ